MQMKYFHWSHFASHEYSLEAAAQRSAYSTQQAQKLKYDLFINRISWLLSFFRTRNLTFPPFPWQTCCDCVRHVYVCIQNICVMRYYEMIAISLLHSNENERINEMPFERWIHLFFTIFFFYHEIQFFLTHLFFFSFSFGAFPSTFLQTQKKFPFNFQEFDTI